MIQALTNFINDAGWLAPLYYMASFVVTALVPVIPTPLVAALGGTAFGYGPAVAYGVFGLALGAVVSLGVARLVGRPLLRKLVSEEVWAYWEQLLGIRSVIAWGVIFFVLNLDFAVTAAGLTTLPIAQLWMAAIVARIPWLVASAWFGDTVLVNDTIVLVLALLLIPAMILVGKLRPVIQGWLLRLGPQAQPQTKPQTERHVEPVANPSEVPQPGVEDVANGVPQEVEAHH